MCIRDRPELRRHPEPDEACRDHVPSSTATAKVSLAGTTGIISTATVLRRLAEPAADVEHRPAFRGSAYAVSFRLILLVAKGGI